MLTEPATAASFAPLPDKGRPGEENAALDEIDAGGRWRAARRDQPTTAQRVTTTAALCGHREHQRWCRRCRRELRRYVRAQTPWWGV